MKAAIVEALGRDPVIAEFDDPVARDGEHEIAVSAAAWSHITRHRAAGAHYSSSDNPPFVVGVDGVGRLADGTRVYFLTPRAPFGGMAEKTAAPAKHCLVLPEGLDDATAAAIAIPGMSSWAALRERAKLKAGETVLVNGATGASGRLAVRIARLLGAGKVIATGRNAQALASLGADVVIPLVDDGDALEARFKAEFALGVDVVLDYLWGASAQRLLIAAAKAGPDGIPIRFVQIGSIGGADITLHAAALRSSSLEMMGSGVGSVGLGRLLACASELFAAAGPNRLQVATRQIPLAEVGRVWNEDFSAARAVFIP